MVAKYCQWDGYPGGQGIQALHFLRDEFDRDQFEAGLQNVKTIHGDLQKRWAQVGAKDGRATMEQSDTFKERWPSLHRDMGTDILPYIQESEGEVPVTDSLDFARDSLFCEWAYVVDLDEETFEVYKGFNNDPVDPEARFFTDDPYESYSGEIYYPVRLVQKWKLGDLPQDDMFMNSCYPEDSE